METSTTRAFSFGLVTLAALIFSIGLAGWKGSTVRAEAGDSSAGAAGEPTADDQANRDAAIEAAQQSQADAVERAHDAADGAQEILQSATQARDQLESNGGTQEQIDAADQALKQAQADKDAAEEAAQKADEATDEAQGH